MPKTRQRQRKKQRLARERSNRREGDADEITLTTKGDEIFSKFFDLIDARLLAKFGPKAEYTSAERRIIEEEMHADRVLEHLLSEAGITVVPDGYPEEA